MPTLPSGRQIEFSLDRFHAHLGRLSHAAAQAVVRSLNVPDDLLFVMDAVHFGAADGRPFFAGYVASDWQACAADWSLADRQALQAWFASSEAREAHAEAIDYIKSLYGEGLGSSLAYPYLMACERHRAGMAAVSALRQ